MKNLEHRVTKYRTQAESSYPDELCSSFSGGRKALKSKHLRIRQEMGISDGIGFQA